MFVCDECGHIFDQPDYETWHENHGNGIVEPWTAKVCPKCGAVFDEEEEIVYVDPAKEEEEKKE